jgi:hypothetical protein
VKPPIEVVNDLLRECMDTFFQAAEDNGLTPPWVVEMTDADGDCICRMAFDDDMNGTADERVKTHKIAPFPFTLVLIDHTGKRLRGIMQAPVPYEPEGGVA